MIAINRHPVFIASDYKVRDKVDKNIFAARVKREKRPFERVNQISLMKMERGIPAL